MRLQTLPTSPIASAQEASGLSVCDFKGEISEVARVSPIRSVDELTQEEMLYQASPEFAKSHGGPITLEVMTVLESVVSLQSEDPAYPYAVVDTRVHMLMPGHIPAIPGWHCDNAPRASYTGQPDPLRASARQKNYTALVGSDHQIAPTEFVNVPVTVPYDPARVWGSCHDYLQAHLRPEDVVSVGDGAMWAFNGQTFHRATPATRRGWRFFFRLSFMSTPPQDKIRRQAMVYAPEGGGW